MRKSFFEHGRGTHEISSVGKTKIFIINFLSILSAISSCSEKCGTDYVYFNENSGDVEPIEPELMEATGDTEESVNLQMSDENNTNSSVASFGSTVNIFH